MGITWMALSNDSTCSHQLTSHSSGFESLQLHSLRQTARAPLTYSLPTWAQGEWEGVSIRGGHVVLNSDSEWKRGYSVESLSSPFPDKYLVRSLSSCGPSSYSCLALEKRSDNILELRL